MVLQGLPNTRTASIKYKACETLGGKSTFFNLKVIPFKLLPFFKYSSNVVASFFKIIKLLSFG